MGIASSSTQNPALDMGANIERLVPNAREIAKQSDQAILSWTKQGSTTGKEAQEAARAQDRVRSSGLMPVLLPAEVIDDFKAATGHQRFSN
jgi:hypothetical protein